ncbi:MAG: DUF4190 domain-containing protein [Candidatus Woesearchaeota archaeon]
MVPAPKDSTEQYYANKNKKLDLGRDVDVYAMWSFLLALSPLVTGLIPVINLLNILTPFASIILGIIGISSIKSNPSKKKGRGFAIAGIIIGAIEIIMIMLLFTFAFALFQGQTTTLINTTFIN